MTSLGDRCEGYLRSLSRRSTLCRMLLLPIALIFLGLTVGTPMSQGTGWQGTGWQEKGGDVSERYVIAVKRERREAASSNWKEPLRSIAGLRIIGDNDPLRVQVEASDEAISEVRRVLGHLCHIEPVIEHRPLN